MPDRGAPAEDAKYCWTCKRSIAPSHWARHLNPAHAAQAAPQQAGQLVAGVGVQLGAGRPQNG